MTLHYGSFVCECIVTTGVILEDDFSLEEKSFVLKMEKQF